MFRFAESSPPSNRLLLTLGSPRESVFLRKPVDSVTVPGAEGYFTLTHNHSLTVAMLKPGVVTVRDGAKIEEFFLSDGFVFFNNGSKAEDTCSTAEVAAIELVPLNALDKEKAAQLLAEINAQPKEGDWQKVRAQLASNLLGQVIKFAQ